MNFIHLAFTGRFEQLSESQHRTLFTFVVHEKSTTAGQIKDFTFFRTSNVFHARVADCIRLGGSGRSPRQEIVETVNPG